MPVLDPSRARHEARNPLQERRGKALFPVCANQECASGWLHVWRSRTAPVIEGGWSCSPECTRARIAELLHREQGEHTRSAAIHRHRVPIGLVLLTEGWISHEQLKQGLVAQRAGAPVRLGAWLIENCGLEERRVTQALSIQWNCPILAIDGEKKTSATVVPRLFIETYGCLPLRSSATGILYVAFEDRIDHSLTLAIERMSGLRVEAGLAASSEFRRAHSAALASKFPRTRIVEAASAENMIDALTAVVEKEKPLQARIVRLHGFYWLRMWRTPGIPDAGNSEGAEDVICSLARFQ